MLNTITEVHMPLIAQAILAAITIVGPVALISTVFAVKDGSPLNRSFWS